MHNVWIRQWIYCGTRGRPGTERGKKLQGIVFREARRWQKWNRFWWDDIFDEKVNIFRRVVIFPFFGYRAIRCQPRGLIPTSFANKARALTTKSQTFKITVCIFFICYIFNVQQTFTYYGSKQISFIFIASNINGCFYFTSIDKIYTQKLNHNRNKSMSMK